jgi:hypothetical protein
MKTLIPNFARISSFIRTCGIVGLVWLFAASNLLAQTPQYDDYGQEIGPPKSYVSVYIIIIFFVGLALTLICRVSSRQSDFRVTE